jgi:hypothetical protein
MVNIGNVSPYQQARVGSQSAPDDFRIEQRRPGLKRIRKFWLHSVTNAARPIDSAQAAGRNG